MEAFKPVLNFEMLNLKSMEARKLIPDFGQWRSRFLADVLTSKGEI
jgi:hypothetical protein